MLYFAEGFDSVIQEIEALLCIDSSDYANRDVLSAVSNIKNKIQRTYAIDVNSLTEHHLDESPALLGTMKYVYTSLASFSHMFRYKGDVPVNLVSVNYFGLTKASLLATLRFLQREDRAKMIPDTVETIKGYIKTVPMCIEKKLLMLLCITYDLKFYEVTAVIAEILYLGDLK